MNVMHRKKDAGSTAGILFSCLAWRYPQLLNRFYTMRDTVSEFVCVAFHFVAVID